MSQLNSTLPSPPSPSLHCSPSPLATPNFFLPSQLRCALHAAAIALHPLDRRRGCKLAKTCNFNGNQQQRRRRRRQTHIYTLPEVRTSQSPKGRIGIQMLEIPPNSPKYPFCGDDMSTHSNPRMCLPHEFIIFRVGDSGLDKTICRVYHIMHRDVQSAPLSSQSPSPSLSVPPLFRRF